MIKYWAILLSVFLSSCSFEISHYFSDQLKSEGNKVANDIALSIFYKRIAHPNQYPAGLELFLPHERQRLELKLKTSMWGSSEQIQSIESEINHHLNHIHSIYPLIKHYSSYSREFCLLNIYSKDLNEIENFCEVLAESYSQYGDSINSRYVLFEKGLILFIQLEAAKNQQAKTLKLDFILDEKEWRLMRFSEILDQSYLKIDPKFLAVE